MSGIIARMDMCATQMPDYIGIGVAVDLAIGISH